jgi:hypothetical protein
MPEKRRLDWIVELAQQGNLNSNAKTNLLTILQHKNSGPCD